MKILPDLRQRKIDHRIYYPFVAIANVALVLACLEVLLRVVVSGPGPRYVFDPELGKRHAGGTSVFSGVEGHGVTHYVADGEIATPYSGGENIVVLGDSHTEAGEVNDDEKFVSVAEKILRQKGYEVDLHNLGFSGGAIADYVYMSHHVNLHYSPKVVVVQVTEEDFTQQESFNPARLSYFVMSEEGLLTIKHNSPVDDSKPLLGYIKHSLALANYGYYRFEEIQNLIAENKGNGHVASASEYATSLPNGVDIVNLQLQAIRVAYPNVPIVILALPHVPRIEGDSILTQDPKYEALLRSIQSAGGFYLVDPLQAFVSLVAQGKLPRGFTNTSPGMGHMNVDGNQIVGALLAQQLEEILR